MYRDKFSLSLAVLSIAVGVCWSSTAVATTLLNIDVNGVSGSQGDPATYSGAAAIGAAGDVWNSYLVDRRPSSGLIDPAQSDNLVYADTTASTVRFDLTSCWPDNLGGNALMGQYAAVADSLGASSATFTLSGLAPSSVYNLYLYGKQGWSTATTFTVGTESQSTSSGAFDGTFTTGRDYVRFANVAADATGTITGTMTAAAIYGAINGLQLQSVPEPSTIVLAAAGLIGLLAYAWRRRK